MIIDTSALIALFNDRDPAHAETVELFGSSTDDLIVSPYVVAELDYLVLTREGVQAELTVLRALSGGAWELAPFDIAIGQHDGDLTTVRGKLWRPVGPGFEYTLVCSP